MNVKDNIKDINIVNEMENSFLDYAMSVIVSRALPDVRDGLKPVHRRILFAMNQISNYSDKPYQKCARTVGEVIGKYHPHGDSSVYDAMVRMAQEFSYRYVLVDGHGNFGSLDGDKAAAMRYTEARMSKLAMYMLRDINKETVDFQENYDGQEKEPIVMPSKFPNLLLNGSTGIAVGMATSIPPHNLSEIINALVKLIDNRDMTINELMNYIKGPDFPTGGIILGSQGISDAYLTGKGAIITKSKAEIIENSNGKKTIIITEIPFQVNKAKILENISRLVREKIIMGISDLRDETNHKGLRVVIEIKRDYIAEVVLNKLFKHTALKSTFSYNNIVLVKGEPKRLDLKQTLLYYLDHQIEILTRKTKYNLKKAEAKIHILSGLAIATQNIDEVVKIIKNSNDPAIAREKLIDVFKLTQIQAKAILEMKLARLTGLEREKLINEIKELEEIIKKYIEILNNKEKLYQIIKNELNEIKEKFGDNRRTEIDYNASLKINEEDIIPKKNVVITLSKSGYIKRIPIDEYRTQNRGGKGVKGQSILEDDSIYKMIYTSTHSDLLFFTDKGKVYRIRAHKVPEFNRQSKGKPIINLINIQKNELVKSLLSTNEYCENEFFFFATEKGIVKKTSSIYYSRVQINGKIAIALREDDSLLDVAITSGNDEILLGNSNGKVIRFSENHVRNSSRKTYGVKGMKVDLGKVISFVVANKFKYLLSVSTRGTGKLTPISDYRLIKRGGKGVKSIKITRKTGKLAEILPSNGNEQLLLITKKGQVIRLNIHQISKSSRNTQGVKLMNIDNNTIQSVVKIGINEEINLDEEDNSNKEG